MPSSGMLRCVAHVPEDGIFRSHYRENPQTLHSINRLGSVSVMRYELGFYIPEDVILHSHRRDNLKSYIKR
jgi:hypothetical protein